MSFGLGILNWLIENIIWSHLLSFFLAQSYIFSAQSHGFRTNKEKWKTLIIHTKKYIYSYLHIIYTDHLTSKVLHELFLLGLHHSLALHVHHPAGLEAVEDLARVLALQQHVLQGALGEVKKGVAVLLQW